MRVAEFFRTIQWRSTLQVALIRICAASFLWAFIILLISGHMSEAGRAMIVFIPLLIIAMLVAIPVIGLARAGVPFIGLLSLPAWLVVIGDPLVYLLCKFKPEWVPVEDFKFINAPVLAVFGADE